jgi:hypothetical protein
VAPGIAAHQLKAQLRNVLHRLFAPSNTIANNVTGVVNLGGTLQSFKNNQIALNGTDGTPIAAFPGPGGTPQQ